MDVNEQIKVFSEFFDREYKPDILNKISLGEKFLDIDFNKLSKFNPDVANFVLDNPVDTIKAVEAAISNYDGDTDGFQIMFSNLPQSTNVPLPEISDPENTGKFLTMQGYIMKPSEIHLKCKAARFECPSCSNIIAVLMFDDEWKEPTKCLPKGTKVWTPTGLKNIELASEVLCVDYEGNLTKSKTKIVNSGIQEVWKINNDVKCSADHLWFVLRNGKCRFLPTKDLNIGDILYQYYGMRSLQKGISARSKNIQEAGQGEGNIEVFRKKNLFRRMQSKIFFNMPKRDYKEKIKCQRNNKTIHPRDDVFKGYSLFDWIKQKISLFKSATIRNKIKEFSRTKTHRYPERKTENAFRQEQLQLQAWQKMWGSILQETGKTEQHLRMPFLPKIKRFISSSQRWRPLESRFKESANFMPFLPYKVSRIIKTHKKVEMYDLQVPDYNNFILENGVITHNCGCGRRGKFRLLSRQMTKFQRLEIQEAIDEVPEKPRRPIKKKILIENYLTRKDLSYQLQPGQMVKIHGFIQLEQLTLKKFKTSNEFKANIIANNVIPIAHSWESITFTTSEKKKILEMAGKKNLLDDFAQSIAPSFEGYVMVRKSLILQHVGGKRILDANGNIEERECIHVAMSGSPGTGKTALLKKSLKISPLWQWTTGAGLTKAGLVACVTKDEYGGYTLEVGPLVMADKGILGIDEMEKMNKGDYGMLNNAMVDEETKITKANIDQRLKTRTSILATSNPTHKKFVPEEAAHKQLGPIPKDILDRFDVIWAMREKIDQEKLESKYMARHLQSESIQQIYTNEEMRNYIAYARRIIPKITDATAKYFKEKFAKLTGKSDDDDEKSHRLRGNILRWAYAHSKFHGIGREDNNKNIDMNKADIDFAFSVIRYSFEMLDLISEEGFAKFEDIEEIPKQKEVNKYYLVRDTLKLLYEEGSRRPVPEFDLLKRIQQVNPDFTDDDMLKELAKLRKMGDVFEPRGGHWAVI